jgi:hypothetical protein
VLKVLLHHFESQDHQFACLLGHVLIREIAKAADQLFLVFSLDFDSFEFKMTL